MGRVMNIESIRLLLEGVKGGSVSIEEALAGLRKLPFEETGYAHLDHHRALRCGMPEVIYCPGKSIEQIIKERGQVSAPGGRGGLGYDWS